MNRIVIINCKPRLHPASPWPGGGDGATKEAKCVVDPACTSLFSLLAHHAFDCDIVWAPLSFIIARTRQCHGKFSLSTPSPSPLSSFHPVLRPPVSNQVPILVVKIKSSRGSPHGSRLTHFEGGQNPKIQPDPRRITISPPYNTPAARLSLWTLFPHTVSTQFLLDAPRSPKTSLAEQRSPCCGTRE